MKRAVEDEPTSNSESADEISEIIDHFKSLMDSTEIDLDELDNIIEQLYAERIIKIDIRYRFLKDHYTKEEILKFTKVITKIADNKIATPAIQFLAAILLLEYPESSANQKVAINYLNAALEKGYKRAHTVLGYMYCCGLGFEKNNKKAEFHFKDAPGDDAFTQFFLGQLNKKSTTEALKYYEESFNLGNNRALFELAKIYYMENPKKSTQLFEASYNNYCIAYEQAMKEHDFLLLQEVNAGIYLIHSDEQGKKIIDGNKFKVDLHKSLIEAMQHYKGHFYQWETVERMAGTLYSFATKTFDKSLSFYQQFYFNCAVRLEQMGGKPAFMKESDYVKYNLAQQSLYVALIENASTEEEFKLASQFFETIKPTDKFNEQIIEKINKFQVSLEPGWKQKIHQPCSDNTISQL